MRLFLAIELSDKIKKEINRQLEEIKKAYPQFQWVPADNYHITVYFFGEIFDPKKIIKKLEQILYDKELFYLYSTSVNLTIQNKITLDLNFRREKEIERISESIKNEFQMTQNSEKYVPRLTLANYKIPSKQQYFVIKKRLSNLDTDISFKVNKLSLFEGEKRIRVFKLI